MLPPDTRQINALRYFYGGMKGRTDCAVKSSMNTRISDLSLHWYVRRLAHHPTPYQIQPGNQQNKQRSAFERRLINKRLQM